MDAAASTSIPDEAAGNRRLAILLAMAMFVLVIDTSMMNVSISAVVKDLGTTVSGVQSAIALEALVSAAFILINSKIGDLIGRKRAYVIGSARLRRRRVDDGAHPEPGPGHHLLGDLRRDRRLAPPARHAVVDPRELRREGASEGLRAGWGGRRHCRRGWTAHRRIHHDLPVVARRLPAGGRHHRGGAFRDQAGEGRAVHGAAGHRRRRRGLLRSGHGRRRAGHPRLAGGRRERWERSSRSASSRSWRSPTGWSGASARAS